MPAMRAVSAVSAVLRSVRRSLRGLSLLLGAFLLAVTGAGVSAGPAAAAGPGTNHAADDPFTSSRTSWFRSDKFGMFIHFGAYSQYEGEYTRADGTVCRNAEWIKRSCGIPMAEYEAAARQFNPSAFDANAIVTAAKNAGQKYIVITSKHHDGYAMWPTKQNAWNLRDHSSFDPGRDLLAELKTAADAQGIKLGFYYSIWDWHDPDFPDAATFPKYRTRMYAQLKELIDGYDPALLWFDGEWDTDNPVNRWSPQDGAALETYLRGLDPQLIINNRVGKRRVVDGDYGTPEQEIPGAPVDGQLWESCMTLNNSWGYAKHDNNWKTATTVVQNLLDISSRSGNYLLNVGPDKLGRIPAPSLNRLGDVGRWLNTAGQGSAVYGTGGATGLVADPAWGAVARKGHDKLYASVFTPSWPAAGQAVHLTAKASFTVNSARVLNSSQTVTVTRAGDGFDIRPSGGATDGAASVIELSITPPSPTAPGTGTGLKAESFANTTFAGTPAATVTDPTINKAYRFDGSPAAAIPADNFATRWTGSIQPRYGEPLTFTTVSDDTVRLWVNGQLVIDNTTPHVPQVNKATVTGLQAGQKYAIKVEHTEQGGEAHMKLLWSSPSMEQSVVPRSQLYAP